MASVALSAMRIAFVNPDLSLGGGTTFLINLAGELIRQEVALKVFSIADSRAMALDFQHLGIPLELGAPNSLIFEDRLESTLLQLSAYRPNVVIVNLAHGCCDIALNCPPGVLRIGVVHVDAQSVFDLASLYAASFDLIVAVSPSVEAGLRRTLVAQIPKPPKIACIELGVPVPMANTPAALKKEPGPVRILYLGRLEDHAKRVRLFPEILKDLEASGIPFVWTLAGEGPERGYLESQMRTKREDQEVRFVGFIPYSGIPDLLKDQDVLLLTSDTESFSLSLHEGMAWGLVPVASNLAGRIRHTVSKEVGILVDPANIQGYAEAIIQLHRDPERMASMRSAAHLAISAEHSVPAMTRRWLNLIGEFKLEHDIKWPKAFRIAAPLNHPKSLKFSKAGRFFRRCGAGLVDRYRTLIREKP